MPLETNLPLEHDLDPAVLTFRGEPVTVKRLDSYDLGRLLKIFNLVREKAGIRQDQFENRTWDLRLGLELAMGLVRFACDSIDLDREDLSLEAKWIFQEVARYIVRPNDQPRHDAWAVATADPDELLMVITRLLEQERDGALGKWIAAIIGAIQRQMVALIDFLKYRILANVGGTDAGGTTGSTIPSELPMDGPTSTSSDSPSDESLTSLEP